MVVKSALFASPEVTKVSPVISDGFQWISARLYPSSLRPRPELPGTKDRRAGIAPPAVLRVADCLTLACGGRPVEIHQRWWCGNNDIKAFIKFL